MIKKGTWFFILIFLIVFSSCKQEPEKDYGTAAISITSSVPYVGENSSRMLSLSDEVVIKDFVYTAIPQFAYTLPPKGMKADFTTLMSATQRDCELTLASGIWLLTVNGRDASNNVILEGQSTVSVSSGSVSAVINLTEKVGTGTFEISVTAPQVSLTGGSARVYYSKDGEAEVLKNLVEQSRDGVNILYTARLSDIPTGYYTLRFEFNDQGSTAGQVMTSHLHNGQTVQISGSMVLSVYDILFAINDKASVQGSFEDGANRYVFQNTSQVKQILNLPQPKSGYTLTSYTYTGYNGSVAPYISDKLLTIGAKTYGNILITPVIVPNTYTVTFNANGGSVSPTSKTVTYGEPYGTLPTPTKANCTFVGWFDD